MEDLVDDNHDIGVEIVNWTASGCCNKLFKSSKQLLAVPTPQNNYAINANLVRKAARLYHMPLAKHMIPPALKE